jgi:ribosomal protein S12 methylthiotransferase accessory factor YcaO
MDPVEKLAATLAKLSDRYDEDALLKGALEIFERASKAIEDGRVTLFEALHIGSAVLQLLRAAAKKG